MSQRECSALQPPTSALNMHEDNEARGIIRGTYRMGVGVSLHRCSTLYLC